MHITAAIKYVLTHIMWNMDFAHPPLRRDFHFNKIKYSLAVVAVDWKLSRHIFDTLYIVGTTHYLPVAELHNLIPIFCRGLFSNKQKFKHYTTCIVNDVLLFRYKCIHWSEYRSRNVLYSVLIKWCIEGEFI